MFLVPTEPPSSRINLLRRRSLRLIFVSGFIIHSLIIFHTISGLMERPGNSTGSRCDANIGFKPACRMI